MSQKLIFKALKEALGNDVLNSKSEAAIAESAEKIKGNEVDSTIQALKDAFGPGVFSQNIERQVRERVEQLEEKPRSAPLGAEKPRKSDEEDAKPNLGPVNNQGDNAGTDVGKPRLQSIKEGVDGDLNAEQKRGFEQDGGVEGIKGSGGNTPTGGARSQIAAATNTGNRAGGPGAAHTK